MRTSQKVEPYDELNYGILRTDMLKSQLPVLQRMVVSGEEASRAITE